MRTLEVSQALSREQSLAVQSFMTKVYAWMCGGLALTAAIGFYLSQHPQIVAPLFRSTLYMCGFIGLEVALVLMLSARANRMSSQAATLMYLLYSALNGVVFAGVFLVYKLGSIGTIFAISAGMFGAMSAYGTLTKRDLTGLRSFLFMGLIGLVVASVVNIWLKSPGVTWALSVVGVIVFTGLTAYDTQKIRQLALAGELSSQNVGISRHNAAIIGALALYLDFINLFISLLQLFGERR